ncbi:MAG: hypothetical protein KDC99_02045 [Cyclobacteriaceae bacterium]|nr:hypothetical protein [Cyclobacteriaceae bacterium]
METYYPLMYMLAAFFGSVLLVIGYYRLNNEMADMESRLTGVWVNDAQTMRIIIHNVDSVFQGEIVWADSRHQGNQLLGATLIRDLVMKKLFQGSTGVYLDPFKGREMPFQMWWKGRKNIKFSLIDKVNGRNKVIREEVWHQI